MITLVQIQKVYAVFFSPTGTTKKIATTIARTIADKLQTEYLERDFTLPQARENPIVFEQSDLIIFGTPVYAGRIPNLLLKYLSTIKANGANAAPIVLYGNRNYDDALIELKDILIDNGCKPIAAGAFIGEHSFSDTLAKNRPDKEDLTFAQTFADKIIASIANPPQNLSIEGIPSPYRGYYQPKDEKGNAIDIRKVKPLTNETCINCKLCAKQCPMGSINFQNVHEITGICIKCCACVKKCPVQAKYFDDKGYLYHKRDLEAKYQRRAQPEMFLE